jgi:hypothetical protein
LKIYVAKFWAQKHNDRRWTDCGYHYSTRPWSYDTNLQERDEGWMVEPFHSIEVEEQDLVQYHLEESNTVEGDGVIIQSSRDLIRRLERSRFKSYYS